MSVQAAVAFPPPYAANFMGPLVMGAAASIFLYGILVCVFSRVLESPAWSRASLIVRTTIVVVVLVTTADVGLAVHDSWFLSTTITADITVLIAGTVPQCIEPALTQLVGFIVQIFLVLRIQKIIPNAPLRSTFIFVLSGAAIFSLYCSIVVAIWGVAYHYNLTDDAYGARFGVSFASIFTAWLWSSAAIDISLTLVYAVALRKRLNSSGPSLEITRSVFRLIILSFTRTAAFTAILAGAAAVTTQIFGTDDMKYYEISWAFLGALCPVYALSLFTTLSIGDNVVQRLSDPSVRRTNGSNNQQSFNAAPSLLPQFVVSTPASAGSRREENEERRGAEVGRTTSFGSAMKGVMVQVEKEEISEGSDGGGSRRTSMV